MEALPETFTFDEAVEILSTDPSIAMGETFGCVFIKRTTGELRSGSWRLFSDKDVEGSGRKGWTGQTIGEVITGYHLLSVLEVTVAKTVKKIPTKKRRRFIDLNNVVSITANHITHTPATWRAAKKLR